MRTAPSQEELRRQNLGALLRCLHRYGAMSRAELTARLGLNRSTVGTLAGELAAAGLVDERPPRETRRAGRPSPVISPRSESVYAYAVSLAVDEVRVARVGLGGVMLGLQQAARPPGEPVASAIVRAVQLVAELPALRRGSGEAPGCVGTGAAISGLARRADGTALREAHPADLQPSLAAAITEHLPGHPLLHTGASAVLAARAELTRGVATEYQDVIYLCGDAGLSAGLLAGGQPVSGEANNVGEVGHMVVRPDGRRCACGSRGCWETEAGERALLRAAGLDDRYGRDAVRAVVDAAGRGDAAARAAVRRVADWLGLGVGNLINIVNPELIIFGGPLRDIFLAAAAPLRSRLNEVALRDRLSRVRLRTPALGDNAALLGAAELAFDRLLADPLGAATAIA